MRPRLLLLTLLPTLICAEVCAMDYYVSPTGSDANRGTGPADGEAFCTIQAGVDHLAPGDTLLILGGTYRETVIFATGGEPGRSITVRPYNEKPVTITGCDPVDGWERLEGGIWRAPMPWTLGVGRNQVFQGGAALIEARHPNQPAPGLEMYVADLSPLWPTFADFSIPDPGEHPGRIVSDLIADDPVDYWKGAVYYGVHFHGWAAQTGIVESSAPGEITVGERTQGWWFPAPYGTSYSPEEGRGMLVGHMHALDRPGEWHWQDNALHLVPTGDDPPTGIEAKRRQLAFDLSGQSHINVEGLNVHAASLRLDGSTNCSFDRCRLTYISHFTHQYGMGQVAKGQDTIRSGETGIFVGGRDNSFTNCAIRFSAGAGFHVRGYHHTIHNCLIDEIDYTSHYLNAITDAVGDYGNYEGTLYGGHVITYNTMRNAGRHFFNFHGNGTSKASRDRAPMDYMATLFAHNHLYNGMLETRDAGFLTGYYCSGGTLDELNSRVVYNAMHDCYDIFGMRINVLGIVYLDAGTCDVDLHHNLLWAAPGSHQRGLWFNTMCVDIHEHDNVFHPQFTRTCAELEPADFPEARPFRFGHDFQNPPPLAEWPQLESRAIEADAVDLSDGDVVRLGEVDFNAGWQSAIARFTTGRATLNSDRSQRAAPRHRHATDPLVLEAVVNDGAEERIGTQWTFVHTVNDGAWLRFEQVPLGDGYRRFRAVYGNDQPEPRTLQVRLDAVDGPLVGTVELPWTDQHRATRVQIYAEATGEISGEATGTHDVYLVFHSGDENLVGEFEYFRFEQYRSLIPLMRDDAVLELHLDDPDGEKVGEFRPLADREAPQDLVTELEGCAGKRTLFLTVRAEMDGPVGTVSAVTLQRARHPIQLAGIGDPPLERDGRMVLPEPTNRPQARPADRYAGRATSTITPQPIHIIPELGAAPTLDGDLADWDDQMPSIQLAESYDGRPTTADPSTLWIARSGDALYVAARHPIDDADALTIESHTWGATDAMEIALQDTFSDPPGPVLNLYGWPDGRFESTDEAGAPEEAVKALGGAVTYAARVGDDAWTCEWRLPFDALGFGPESAPALRANFGVLNAALHAWSIWHGTGGATHRVENGGSLVFSGTALDAIMPKGDLEVWLDASAADAVDTDDDGRVVTWRDRSGNGRDATQPDAEFRPEFTPDGLNGRPAIRFTEKRRTRLELPDISQERISATIFVVFTNPEPGAEVNHDARLVTASDGEELDYVGGLAATVPGRETGGPRQSVHAFADRAARHVRIGCFSPYYQTFFTGAIAEVLVYSRDLEPGERDLVRAYLKLKWGLE